MSNSPAQPLTLAEKVWRDHVVVPGDVDASGNTNPDLIYIDLHLVHEVTSPQAFEGLRLAGRPVRRPDLTIATEDHNVPTVDIDKPQRLRGLDEDAYVRGGRIVTCDHLLRKTSRVLPASPHLLHKTSRVPSPRRRALTTRG